jgi:hypothetical protein
MPNPRFIAKTKTKNLRVEIWINDIPTVLIPAGEKETTVSVPLNENIIPDVNKIGAMLHAAPLASSSADPWPDDPAAAQYSGGASLDLQVAIYADDQPVHKDGPPTLTTIEWQGGAQAVPHLEERTFPGVEALGRWAWQDAEVFAELDDGLRQRALDYLEHLHGLLSASDFETFVAESNVKIRDYAHAYGIPAGPVRQGMLSALRSQAGKFPLRPLTPDEVDLRLIAGGRLIECLRKDRHHALEFGTGSGPSFFLPAKIGVAEGKWQMLR